MIETTPEYGLVGRVMVIVEVGSRTNAPTTLIREEEGDHDDDSETLSTANRKQYISLITET